MAKKVNDICRDSAHITTGKFLKKKGKGYPFPLSKTI
jgi:hypothetical protein